MWSNARYTCVVPLRSSTCSRASFAVQASRDDTCTSSASRSEERRDGCPGRRSPRSPRSGSWPIRRSARGAPFRLRRRRSRRRRSTTVTVIGPSIQCKRWGPLISPHQGAEDASPSASRRSRSRSSKIDFPIYPDRDVPLQVHQRPGAAAPDRGGARDPEPERRDHLRRDRRHRSPSRSRSRRRFSQAEEVAAAAWRSCPASVASSRSWACRSSSTCATTMPATSCSTACSTGSARSTPPSAPTRTTARSAA